MRPKQELGNCLFGIRASRKLTGQSVGSKALTISPMEISSGARARRMPPLRPRRLSRSCATPSWCTVFCTFMKVMPVTIGRSDARARSGQRVARADMIRIASIVCWFSHMLGTRTGIQKAVPDVDATASARDVHAAQASAKASKTCASIGVSPYSGCHCMPRQKPAFRPRMPRSPHPALRRSPGNGPVPPEHGGAGC